MHFFSIEKEKNATIVNMANVADTDEGHHKLSTLELDPLSQSSKVQKYFKSVQFRSRLLYVQRTVDLLF